MNAVLGDSQCYVACTVQAPACPAPLPGSLQCLPEAVLPRMHWINLMWLFYLSSGFPIGMQGPWVRDVQVLISERSLETKAVFGICKFMNTYTVNEWINKINGLYKSVLSDYQCGRHGRSSHLLPLSFPLKLAVVCIYVKHSSVFFFLNLSWKTVNISLVSIKWNPNPQLGIWGPLQHSLILPTTSSTNALLLFQLSYVIFGLAFSSPLWNASCGRPSWLLCCSSTLPTSLTWIHFRHLSFSTQFNLLLTYSLFHPQNISPWKLELCLLFSVTVLVCNCSFPSSSVCSQH